MNLRSLLSILGVTFASAFSLGASAGYEFSVPTFEVTEGGRSTTITVTRTVPFTGVGSVAWTTANGTAVAGVDFGTAGNATQKTGTLSWLANTGGAKTITVISGNIPIINDPAVEAAKSFTVGLSNPVGGALNAQSQIAITILDTDSNISLVESDIAVSEGGPNTVLTLARTGGTSVSQAVTFKTSNGSAVASGDYTAVTTGKVTFAAGETLKTIAVGPTVVPAPSIRIMNDTLIEGPETFTVTLSAPTGGASLGTNTSAIVTILSDDNGVSMGAATRSFAEGAGAQEILVFRSGTGAGVASVNYAFINGTATNTNHFNGTNGTLNWGIGDLDPKAIAVNILDNGDVNATRMFTVSLSGATGFTIGTPTSTAVSITDNDNTLQFSAATAIATEGTNLTLTVTRIGGNGAAASVTWTSVDGTALAGTDFGAAGFPVALTGTLSWDAGVSTSKQVIIPIINDTTVEGAKTFSVALSNPVGSGVSLGANDSIAVTLNDNDKGFSFSSPTYEVTEGTTTVTLTVNRIGPPAGTASATYATVNGSAVSGTDFTAKTGTLSWTSGNMVPKTFTVAITNNAISTGDKSFTVNLTPSAGFVLAGGPATVTIHDDDIPPQSNVRFVLPKYTVVENIGPLSMMVERVMISSCALAAQVNYATVAGTAAATSDYTTKTGVLNWAPGECGAKEITLNIVNNALVEPPESFRVTLSAPSPGLGISTPVEGGVLILDDDELFPKNGALSADFYQPPSDRGWHISNDPLPFEGQLAMRSDQIEANMDAGFALAGTFAAGNVSFRVKVSTELNFDFLRFFIDGVEMASWSGTVPATWQLSPSFPITAGVHELKWIYEKDVTVSVGSDAVWLDGLVTPAYTPVP